ncbi:MAG: flagellar basal body protein, partial [Lachnospiraceae bacterium]|nr:flagellar basal body protein [Lachnospiraceae bacterium]
MVKGLYTAWTGMVNAQKRLDVLSNNLANADTTGYKKEGTTTQSFDNKLALKIKDTSSIGYARKLGTVHLGVKIG